MSLAKAVALGGLAVALGLTAVGRLPSGSHASACARGDDFAAGSHAFELSLVGPATDGLAPGQPDRGSFACACSRTASEALSAPRLRVRSPLGWALDRVLPEPMAPGESIEIAFEIEPAPGLSSICAEVLGRIPDRPSAALVRGSDRLCFDPSHRGHAPHSSRKGTDTMNPTSSLQCPPIVAVAGLLAALWAGGPPSPAAADSLLIVNSTADTVAVDSVLTLREALLHGLRSGDLANGTVGISCLTTAEWDQMWGDIENCVELAAPNLAGCVHNPLTDGPRWAFRNDCFGGSDGTGNGARLRRYHSVPSVHRVGGDLGRPLAVPPRPPRRRAGWRRPRRARGLFGSGERAGARHEAGRHRSGLRALPDRRRESRDLRLPRRLHPGAGAGRVDVSGICCSTAAAATDWRSFRRRRTAAIRSRTRSAAARVSGTKSATTPSGGSTPR